MITTSIASSLAAPTTLFGEVGQRCFKLSRPFLSHPSPRCPAGTHATKEPHPQPIQVSSRKESEPTKHLPETDRPAGPGQETAAGRADRALVRAEGAKRLVGILWSAHGVHERFGSWWQPTDLVIRGSLLTSGMRPPARRLFSSAVPAGGRPGAAQVEETHD